MTPSRRCRRTRRLCPSSPAGRCSSGRRRTSETGTGCPVGVHNRGLRGPQTDLVAQRSDGQRRLHPRVDGVAHDLVRVQVLDRAHVELPLGGGVLADIGHPHSVRRIRGEGVRGAAVLVDHGEEVVVDRRTGLAVQPTLLGVRRPQPLGRAEPPDAVVADLVASVRQVISDEAIAELRVIACRSIAALVR